MRFKRRVCVVSGLGLAGNTCSQFKVRARLTGGAGAARRGAARGIIAHTWRPACARHTPVT